MAYMLLMSTVKMLFRG